MVVVAFGKMPLCGALEASPDREQAVHGTAAVTNEKADRVFRSASCLTAAIHDSANAPALGLHGRANDLDAPSTQPRIEAADAELIFLSPYSPDLNPIELIFAKAKQHLRSLACRTREARWYAMQSVLGQISATDAANCFRHCGYTLRSG